MTHKNELIDALDWCENRMSEIGEDYGRETIKKNEIND